MPHAVHRPESEGEVPARRHRKCLHPLWRAAHPLRCFMNGLNPHQYQTAYISLPTGVTGFYWEFCTLLGLESSGNQSLYKSKKIKMPKPELYVIYTGNKGRKPDTISLSQEFFDGADIDIEIKAKVIYESDKDNIINEYIVFCKVFNEQVKGHGMTKLAVIETIRICKDRSILKQYLSSKEVEVVTIMMSLFDDEQIMKTYTKDIKRETLMENAKHMLKMGKLTVEEIPVCYPDLTIDDAKEIEEEFIQFA